MKVQWQVMCAAISILQDHILAADSPCDPDKVFPHGRLATESLELAESLLGELLDVLDRAERQAS
ncbi:MAG: hypothetical protein ACU0CC_07580 [Sagittula sp.]|uniref:hypothetical protein n=1 Tax=Sagittula sp. TaxID=2038081 RepID=UPI004058E6C5